LIILLLVGCSNTNNEKIKIVKPVKYTFYIDSNDTLAGKEYIPK